jgi:hypothetical protein
MLPPVRDIARVYVFRVLITTFNMTWFCNNYRNPVSALSHYLYQKPSPCQQSLQVIVIIVSDESNTKHFCVRSVRTPSFSTKCVPRSEQPHQASERRKSKRTREDETDSYGMELPLPFGKLLCYANRDCTSQMLHFEILVLCNYNNLHE